VQPDKFDKFLKKVKTYLGVEVHQNGNKYWFQYDNRVGSFYKQENWRKPGTYEASSFHTRHKNDHTDTMSDYFAGTFWDNGTQMLHSLKPPAPKFPIGTLVIGKDNKRANRHGYAGRMGVVVEAGRYMKLHWAAGAPTWYALRFPERDFEKVA